MLRFCALDKCGTRVLIGAQADRYATGEHTLAEREFASGAIDPGMLILADRRFIGWLLWQKDVMVPGWEPRCAAQSLRSSGNSGLFS